MSDTVVLPRAVAEALVDPQTALYMRESYVFRECAYCWFAPERGETEHDRSCPVRITQETLREQPNE